MGSRTARLVVAVVAGLLLAGCGAKKLAKQGESLLQDGRATHAARCYAKACEKRPSKASFQLGYARALLADGQADKAVAPARIALDDELVGADVVLIEALVRTRQLDEARTLLERARQERPGDPDVLELTAREHLVRGEPRQAVVAMKKVVEIEASGPRIAYLGWLLARAGEMPRAIEAAERAFGTKTDDIEALGDVAAVFLLAGRDAQRKDTVREIQSFGSEVVKQWQERAGRAQQVGDHESALRAMTAAVAVRPSDGELKGLLGQMMLSMGEQESAVTFLLGALQTDAYRVSWERAVSYDETNAVHTMGFEDEKASAFARTLARAYESLGQTAKAADALRAALLIGGDRNPDNWVEAGRLFLLAKDLRGAGHAGHFAYDLDPSHPGALVFLLKLYASAGDVGQAIGYGRLAWQALPGDPLVALTLGELYERRGDPVSARDLYAVALEQHPEIGALRKAMQRVERR